MYCFNVPLRGLHFKYYKEFWCRHFVVSYKTTESISFAQLEYFNLSQIIKSVIFGLWNTYEKKYNDTPINMLLDKN